MIYTDLFGYQTNYGFSVLERGQFLMAKHQNIDVGQLYIFIDDDFSKLPIDISTSCLLLDNLRAQAEYAMKQSEAAEQALIEQAREMQEFKRSQSFITTQQPVALTRRHEQLNQLRQNVFKIPER